jgi:ubiquinone biosynthesis protein COQ4
VIEPALRVEPSTQLRALERLDDSCGQRRIAGYTPDVEGELALQAFTYAQLGAPSARIIAVLGTLFKSPRSARLVWEGYRRGKAWAFLPVVRFEDLWERDLEELRRELHIRPRGAGSALKG